MTTVKIVADDTSLFYVVNDPVSCAHKLKVGLEVINEWADQWKFSFNTDPSKQAVDICFSRKYLPIHAPGIIFNGFIDSNQGSRTLTPRTITPRTLTTWTLTPRTITPRTITPPDINPPVQITPRTITPRQTHRQKY